MKIIEETHTLKNRSTLKIRNGCKDDAAELINYLTTCNSETEFLVMSAGEMKLTIPQEEMWIKNNLESPNLYMYIAEVDGKIAGTAQIRCLGSRKTKHRGNVGIALLSQYWHLGIGTILFNALIKQAQELHLEQIELNFTEGNFRGQGLYEKMGFKIVAKLPNAFIFPNGERHAEYTMIKEIKPL
ncbi:MAG: GNAT family N-acetyltransferase [Bacilli bacterium]|nr:GNAT family N-acetyltransferase [Bacilli bacterium]MDD4066329.1 GNAT family N-acetyltransferase [Bacilli bacterium]